MGFEKHECPRCGCQWNARNSAYRDELIEWIQHTSGLESSYRRQVARLEQRLVLMGWDLDYYRMLAEHLVVPSLEQIELISLRSIIAEVEQGGARVVDEAAA